MTRRLSLLPLLVVALAALANRALAIDTAPDLQRYFTALDRAYAAWQAAPLRPSAQDVANVRRPLDEAASAKAELVLMEGKLAGDNLIDLEKQLTATKPCFDGLINWIDNPATTPTIVAPKPAPVRKLFRFHNTDRQIDPKQVYRAGGSTYNEPIAGSNLALKHITPHLALLSGGDRAYIVTPNRKSHRVDRTTLWALGAQPRPIVGAQPLEAAKPEDQILAAGAERIVRDLRTNDPTTASLTIRLLSSNELALFTSDLQSGPLILDLVAQEQSDRQQLYREHLDAHPALKGEKYETFEPQLLRARALSLVKELGAPAALIAGMLQGARIDVVVQDSGQISRVNVRPNTDVGLEHGMLAIEGVTIAMDQVKAFEPSTYTAGPLFNVSISSLWHRHRH